MCRTYYLYPSPFTNRGHRADDARPRRRGAGLLPARAITHPPARQWPPVSEPVGLADAYCGIGQVYHRKGDDAQALDAFDQAIRVQPAATRTPHVGRGEALIGLGEFDKAPAQLQRGHPARPEPLAGRTATGPSAFERVGNDEAALADYDAAIRLDPNAATARRLRAALLSRLGRNDQAVPDLDEAIRARPEQRLGLQGPRRRLQPAGRPRPRAPRPRRGDPARPEKLEGVSEPRGGLQRARPVRARGPRLRRGAAARPEERRGA